VLSRLADRVYVISGGAASENLKLRRNVHLTKVVHKVSSNVFMRIVNYMHTELEILCYTLAVSRRVDFFVFFIGGEGLFTPILTLKLLRKKILLMLGGVAAKGYLVRKDPFFKVISMSVGINSCMVDRLIVYSQTLAQEANLVRHQRKIIIAHEHFVDFKKFAIEKKTDERLNVVGYIGRLSKEKGILNLIEAMPLVLKKRTGIRFMICGNGSLTDDAEKITKTESLKKIAKLTGWIPHEDVPRCLNEIQLLVLPSLTEGLPNILLEAMACGTPVLATAVGMIPEIIEDGETGFLLKSIDPKHIADRIVELLDKPKLLEKISKNAYEWVRENFSEEKTLESWRRVFQELDHR
jgi:glycosyltransferase involved in cell wall biosynthesis